VPTHLRITKAPTQGQVTHLLDFAYQPAFMAGLVQLWQDSFPVFQKLIMVIPT